MHGTRALQMAKVTRALNDHVAGGAGQDAVFVLSGLDSKHAFAAQAWQAEAPDLREYLPYRMPAATNRRFSRTVAQIRHTAAKLSRNAPFVAQAVRQTKTIIDRFSPDVLLTVANPMLWHRVGLALKREFPDLPWVAFFSDPRPLGLLPKPFRSRNPMNIHKARLSRRILQRSDAIIGPNRYMLDWMETRLAVSLQDRKFVIPHCGQVASTPSPIKPDDLRGWLLHVGSLWKGQVTVDLLNAIRHTAQKYPAQFKGLMCVGDVVPEVMAMIRSLNAEPYVKLAGRVSPAEACSLIASADATLLADTPLEIGYFLHSKFADYAVNGRPILVVGPARCPMRDYLETHGGGVAVTHRQEEIERALHPMFGIRAPETIELPTSQTSREGGRRKPVTRAMTVSAESEDTADLAEPFRPANVGKEYFRVLGQVSGSVTRHELSSSAISRDALRRGA